MVKCSDGFLSWVAGYYNKVVQLWNSSVEWKLQSLRS